MNTKNHQIRIIIYIIIGAVIAAVGVFLVLHSNNNKSGISLQDKLDLGHKYLVELSYDKAVLEFTDAIEIDPMNADAYLGLADAYIGQGDTDKAVEVLEDGFDKTGDERIKEKLDELKPAEETTSVTNEMSPVSPAVQAAVEKENKIFSEGDHYAMLYNDGALYMWGDNEFGQLGIGRWSCMENSILYNGIDDPNYLNTNDPIKIMDNVTDVSLDFAYSAAITQKGDLYMWGDNYCGQLGIGSTDACYSPTFVMENIASVNVGYDRSAAITVDGDLYMWGENEYGELGIGSTNTCYSPTFVMENVESVFIRSSWTYAITEDGELYIWGENIYNNGSDNNAPMAAELGVYENNDGEKLITVPTKIMDNVSNIVGNNAAITKDGSLCVWGNSEYDRLAINNGDESAKIMDNVVTASCAGVYAVITRDASMYVFGEYFDSIVYPPVKYMDNVKKVVFCNYDEYYGDGAVITTDGTLYKLGGDYERYWGEDIKENAPIKIMENVADIEIGASETFIVKDNGEVYKVINWHESYDADEISGALVRLIFES